MKKYSEKSNFTFSKNPPKNQDFNWNLLKKAILLLSERQWENRVGVFKNNLLFPFDFLFSFWQIQLFFR